jgi:hypothetical protein
MSAANLLPTKGRCPRCKRDVSWPDIIAASVVRRSLFRSFSGLIVYRLLLLLLLLLLIYDTTTIVSVLS